MDRSGPDSPLLERILCSARPVVVLLGGCASGKTSVALAMYGRFLDRGGRAKCLLVVPNAPAVAMSRRKLLSRSPAGVIVSPQVTTFAGLAGRIIAASGRPARTLPAFQRHLLLRRIVDELQGEDKLTALSAVADTPGLIVALDRAIAELKRATVEPAALGSAVGSGNNRGRDLVEVYRLYQEHLLTNGTYDVEGLMWQAREHLAASREAPAKVVGMEGVEAVAVDGFTDFTPTQLRMLALLCERLRRVLITLPFEQDGRDRMWHWTQRTLNNIRAELGDRLEEVRAERTPSPGATEPGTRLSALWGRLFDMDAAKCELPDGLEVIVASGLDAEVAAVARRVKRLLLDGSPAGSIAVLARSLEVYRPAIERIFRAADIPIAPAPRALSDAPIVRFVLDVASLGPKFAFPDVLRAIKNSYFRPSALGGFGPAEVAAAEMLIREGNVLEGRPAYVEAAKRLAARAARREEGDEEEEVQLGTIAATPRTIQNASDMLEKLFDLSEGAVERRDRRSGADESPRIAIRGLASIITNLDLQGSATSHDDPALVARDLRALATLEDVLRHLDGAPLRPAYLREALGAVSCPAARGESMVDVFDVLDARALRYDHVFLLGLGEGVFPRRFVEGSLVGEADRIAWAARGLVLDSRRDLTAREMLLFYLAASRADRTLTLSYLESDASGRAGAPSSFLLSLLEPAGGLKEAQRANRIERILPGEFLPPAEVIASRRDALNAAIAGLFQENPAPFGPALSWAASNAAGHLARAAAGLSARNRRWRKAPCDAFDGRIDDPALLRDLAGRYPTNTVFSASMLNCFAQCPWQFFATYVLKLAPLARPERLVEAVSRGLFCHEVLFEVFTRLRGQDGRPVRLADVEESRLLAVLDEAVAAAARDVEARRPPYPVLWRIQREQMHREVRDYLFARRAQADLPSEALYFELCFGLEEAKAGRVDPASRDDPISLSTPAGEVRIRGKIDRVDRVRVEGEAGLFVIDYKTGRMPTPKEVNTGANLQLPVYVEAVEQVLGEKSLGGAFQKIGEEKETLFAAVKKARGGYKIVEGFDDRRRAAAETIGGFVAAMREGRFDLVPTHKCPSYCPFRQICHYADARAALKAGPTEEVRP